MIGAISDEELMRWADGELDPAGMARVEQCLAADQKLAARAALYVETRSLARAAFAPHLAEEVPPALRAAVENMAAAPPAAAGAVPFPHPTRSSRVQSSLVRASRVRGASPRFWPAALAASLVAGLAGGAVGYRLGKDGGAYFSGMHVAGIDNASVNRALLTVPSGQEISLNGMGRMRAIATFRDGSNNVCREFEVDLRDGSSVVSVACRMASNWRTLFAVLAPAETGGYAPASSTEALDAYLLAIEAGTPLGEEDERAALLALRE